MSELTDSIVAAFAGNVHPDDDRLTVYNQDALTHDETRRLLLGCDWRDFPAAEFISGDTPFPDLSPEAFHYYMPAVLLASIDPELEVNSDIAQSLTFYLSPSSAFQEGKYGYDDRENFQQRMSLFTPTQRRVMVETLRRLVPLQFETEFSIAEAVEFLSAS